jgi:hypothetical protein
MQKAFVPPEVLTMIEMETYLSKNIYLSGTENPGQIDSKMIDHLGVRLTRQSPIVRATQTASLGTGPWLSFRRRHGVSGTL